MIGKVTYLSTSDRLIPRRVLLIDTCIKHGASLIEVEAKEERHADAVDSSTVVYPMHRRLELVI